MSAEQDEVEALRAEVAALRAEVSQLRAMLPVAQVSYWQPAPAPVPWPVPVTCQPGAVPWQPQMTITCAAGVPLTQTWTVAP